MNNIINLNERFFMTSKIIKYALIMLPFSFLQLHAMEVKQNAEDSLIEAARKGDSKK